jgi:fused signal recognition particle receptor
VSGFFKKLFNRVIGRKEEPPPPDPAPPSQLLPPAEPAVPEAVSPPPAEASEPVQSVSPEPESTSGSFEAAEILHTATAPEPARNAGTKAAKPAKPSRRETSSAAATGVAVKTGRKAEPVKKPESRAKASPKTAARPRPTDKAPAAQVAPPPAARRTSQRKAIPSPEPIIEAPLPERSEPPPAAPQARAAQTESAPEFIPQSTPPILEEEREMPESAAPEEERAATAAEPQLSAVKDEEPAAPQRRGWLSRLKEGLSKSSKTITSSITSIFTKRKLDAATLEELEDVLIQADLGLPMAERIVKAVSAGRYDREIDPQLVRQILADEVAKVLKPVEVPFNFGEEKPFVILVVGVNGSGKTTTIGKLGAIAASEGFKVMFAACDTFRAAAIEQLTIWGQRIGAVTMSRPTGSDASGLAYDALNTARQSGTDILFIDTAGRLQNKAHLMDELDKIVRVLKKQDPSAPHAVLLVLDATTGQNAMAQAEVFTRVAGVTGLIMTKLDGTARGGILVAIAEKFKLPVHAIGIGEKIEDLQPFDAEAFSRAIAGLEDA